MGINVYLAPDKKTPRRGDNSEHVFEFSDDGYFWFLHPLLGELKLKTGQTIDLYEDAFFSGAALDMMLETIEEARDLLSKQPDVWRQHTGTQTHPVQEEIYREVRKKDLEELLGKWENAAHRAKNENAYLSFWGD